MKNIIVIKCGGSMIDTLSDDFFIGIKKMQETGFYPVIVHGGGPAINDLLKDLQIQSEFVNGLRKTTHEIMEVVEMVLSGTITNKLVRKFQKHGISSIGITGSDGGLMYAKPKDLETLGLVGEITRVNQKFLTDLLSIGMVPVISPIAIGLNHEDYYNINADTVAGEIAVALNAEKVIFVTDVPGVLKDNEIIEKTTESEILGFIDDGTISGGMIPKVMAAIHSLNSGMKEAMIVSGHKPLLDGVQIKGTTIKKELEAVK
ncbi:acetylglutamate kinase [Bacillus sp. FJAT-49732]|uniref:Acetylglutamate kinase n=1 Tax=Lederbergia citrisecunda TaxID=2833583 RepID=A0A942TLT7_9BACI|nr:acetylglutamate kinase [Lederbergia citrisecunda]MBS4199096.1 acetylglutamate kinase [Lederbergia citrisecunda]